MTPAFVRDLLLYFCNGPAIGGVVNRSTNFDRRLNSRCQLVYRIAHRLAEVVQFLVAHPSSEGSADIGTRQSEFYVVLFVDHRVLATREPAVSRCRRDGSSPGS